MSDAQAVVLMVDDNPVKRAALCAALDPLKLELVEADSGRSALRELLTREFALVLLDINLPDMDGFEVAELMRARPQSAHTPILYITAERESDIDRLRGYASGAVDFIIAPVVPVVLRSKVAVFVDLYRMRHEALALAERLERADRMKSEFLRTMSHELRTPLNAIIGFSDLLKNGLVGPLTEQQSKFMGHINSSGHHLLSLIDDILDLSRIQAGKMPLELDSVAIPALLANALTMLKSKAKERGIGLEMQVDPRIDTVSADLRKLKQIVYNLLSNAVKFTPDGGHVVLAARRVPRAQVASPGTDRTPQVIFAPTDTTHAEFLELRVTDSGIGIAHEGLGRLFEPFVQLDSKLARNYQGSGLGLSLVKNFVELHGGALACASQESKGSVFSVWIPWRTGTFADPDPSAPFSMNGALGA